MAKELKQAKKTYKESLKNPVRHNEEKEILLKSFIDSKIPKWGNLKIIVI